MNEKIRNLLEQEDWKRITLELIEYAQIKAMRLKWRTGSYKDLPQGKTPEDIAHEAIEKVFSGDRQWNPDKDPVLLNYLKSVVDSLISHLVESEDHRRLQQLPETEEGTIREDVLQQGGSNSPSTPVTPEEELLKKERDEQIFSKITETVDGDAELELIVDAIMEDHVKPAEIASAKNMDIKSVYQLIRKLKRRVMKLDILDIDE